MCACCRGTGERASSIQGHGRRNRDGSILITRTRTKSTNFPFLFLLSISIVTSSRLRFHCPFTCQTRSSVRVSRRWPSSTWQHDSCLRSRECQHRGSCKSACTTEDSPRPSQITWILGMDLADLYDCWFLCLFFLYMKFCLAERPRHVIEKHSKAKYVV